MVGQTIEKLVMGKPEPSNRIDVYDRLHKMVQQVIMLFPSIQLMQVQVDSL